MFLSILLLILSVNIDSLGVGLVYGIKKIYISFPYKTLICLFSVFYSSIAILVGNSFFNLFSVDLGKHFGIAIFLLLGLYSIFRAIYPINNNKSIFKSLGTSIDVVKNSPYIDIDNSSNIDFKEAILLSFALSIDSIGSCFAFSVLVKRIFLIPLLIGLFQFIFINIGLLLGKKISTLTCNKFINAKLISILPGILLILIALFRI